MSTATSQKLDRAINAAPEATDIGDWLAVSTEGFAEQNAGRDPAHLVKELVQNSLDALQDMDGGIDLTFHMTLEGLVITCTDTGTGVQDLENIRTVFWTSKKDSHTKRGRMGRGFKEMLCLAKRAVVTSGKKAIHFTIDAKGRRGTKQAKVANLFGGTKVEMVMPWERSVIADLEKYFSTFLIPGNVIFTVNGREVDHRSPRWIVEDVSLTTESFTGGKWIKPSHKTNIQLVALRNGEEKGLIYEMGIPITSAEWDRPYHINILQRVPQNPNRDAVQTGFAGKLHRACLPSIIDEMTPEQVRSEWVGTAAAELDDDIQKDVIAKGFGDNVARSVPSMGGRYDFNEQARADGDIQVVDTRQLSTGFRKIVQEHVPTTREVVETNREQQLGAAIRTSFTVTSAYSAQDAIAQARRSRIDAAGGRLHVSNCLEWWEWFVNQLLGSYNTGKTASVEMGEIPGTAAKWGNSWGKLTVDITSTTMWESPFGNRTLGKIIHETAREHSHVGGLDFRNELEHLAGVAARLMIVHSNHIRERWGGLIS